ncbi:MAG: hypothetical protein UT32_C0001G0133 [Parcubacteria group bacterium GW2011_GWC2_39_14]|nr:MAG: hypothetical protein UT32_C0001G0133 [Parcubacteria group bacterium GW2011_GWC2_39_14]KKR55557.1 MAG: hypothetical protein UT91_C0001G0132 [Parcubacteria group bacterium GW2011_GWA2_40_23]
MGTPGSIKPKQIGKVIVYSVIFIMIVFAAGMLITRIPTSTKQEDVKSSSKKITSFEEDLVEQAQQIYAQKKAKNVDFKNGSCLSDSLASTWVVDIAHDPRQAIDDLPENQCPSFISGKTQHFIELDPDGQLIRLQ